MTTAFSIFKDIFRINNLVNNECFSDVWFEIRSRLIIGFIFNLIAEIKNNRKASYDLQFFSKRIIAVTFPESKLLIKILINYLKIA